MILNRERPETDNFTIKKISVCEEKIPIFQEIHNVIFLLAGTLTKYSEKAFAYSCVSEHSGHFFPLQKLIFT